MIEYTLNGAWGKTIPDEKLKERLMDFGVELVVEARRDGLSNVEIRIDDEKILKRKKRNRTVKKITAEDATPAEKEKKTATKKAAKKS